METFYQTKIKEKLFSFYIENQSKPTLSSPKLKFILWFQG